MGKKYISALALFAVLAFNASAQSVIKVISKSGDAAMYSMDESANISFAGSNMVVRDGNGAVSSFDISGTQKLLVNSTPLSVEESIMDGAQQYRVYPNPTTGILNVDGDIIGKSIFIYDITGRLQMHIVANASSLDLSSLRSGVYLVKIESQTYRIIKQ